MYELFCSMCFYVLCVCMWMYMCVCMWMHMCVCMWMYVYWAPNARFRRPPHPIHSPICMHVSVHACVHTCACMFLFRLFLRIVCMHVWIFMCIERRTHDFRRIFYMYVSISMYVCMHVCMHVLSWWVMCTLNARFPRASQPLFHMYVCMYVIMTWMYFFCVFLCIVYMHVCECVSVLYVCKFT